MNKTLECPLGHKYTDENRRVVDGVVHCAACSDEGIRDEFFVLRRRLIAERAERRASKRRYNAFMKREAHYEAIVPWIQDDSELA